MASKFVPVNQEDPMSTLSRMVTETNYEDLPDNIVNVGKQHILDQMGVTIGGSSLEFVPVIVELVKSRGGKPESIIPFYGGKVPAPEAGFAIGPMARAMDFGMDHAEGGHNAECNLPALLAATGLKDRVTGKEFITAFILAQEVFTRTGIAGKFVTGGSPLRRIAGNEIFGPVAGVGKLLALSLEELEDAQGIASEMTQPHSSAMYTAGSPMIYVHHGFVCQDAINCCLLAQRGIAGPHKGVLAAPQGYLGFAKWETEPEALTRDLGEKWEFPNTMLKPYSCVKTTHTANYGLIEQMKKHHFTAEDIANIHVEIDAGLGHGATEPKEAKWNPQTAHECQFSLPYTMAVAAYDQEIITDSFSPEARARKDIRELMTRISASKDPNLPRWGARVYTTLKDGKEYSDEVLYAKGHPKIPFTEQELIDKFRKCVAYSAYKLSDDVVDTVINTLWHLEEVDDVVSALILPLTPE
ncbi:MmgE/PrpD family protein [Chloroflexota bacterium]